MNKKITAAAIGAMALVACVAVFHLQAAPVEDVKYFGESLTAGAFTEADDASDSIWDGGQDSMDQEDYSPVPAQVPSGLSMIHDEEEEDEDTEEDSDDSNDEASGSDFFNFDNNENSADDESPASNELETNEDSDDSLSDGDDVEVQYVLRDADTGKEIYRQWGDGDGGSFNFQLGGGHVIPGFDSAIGEMSVGEEKDNVYISSDDAYGEKGMAAAGIKPNTNLEYDLKVVKKN